MNRKGLFGVDWVAVEERMETNRRAETPVGFVLVWVLVVFLLGLGFNAGWYGPGKTDAQVERYTELNACYMDTRCRMTVEEFAEFRRLREEMSRP